MNELLKRIETAITEIGHGWTSVEKAQTMAKQIVELRPEISVEIGVYAGKGMVSMALANDFIDYGMVIGIDPYLPRASVEGQLDPNDQKFWGALDHEAIYKLCQENLLKYGVSHRALLLRSTSDDFAPPENIGFLRIDGNHGEQAARDFERYAPKMKVGGLLYADDINWTGMAISKAVAKLKESGQFVELMAIDDGVVLKRIK